MENWIVLIYFIVIIVGVGCFLFFRNRNNRKVAQTGQDKASIRNAVAPLFAQV